MKQELGLHGELGTRAGPTCASRLTMTDSLLLVCCLSVCNVICLYFNLYFGCTSVRWNGELLCMLPCMTLVMWGRSRTLIIEA